MILSADDPLLVALRAAAAGDETAQTQFWRLRRERAIAGREVNATDTWANLDPFTRSMLDERVGTHQR